MRYLPSRHRIPALFGLALLALPLLSGCGFGISRGKFVARANTACAHSAARIAALDQPDTPLESIGYAIDVFEQKDRLLTELNEADLPSSDASALRTRWLHPATRDLDRARAYFAPIRQAALSADTDRLTTELNAMRKAGTAGVDDSLLSRYGLTDCLRVFGGSARTATGG